MKQTQLSILIVLGTGMLAGCGAGSNGSNLTSNEDLGGTVVLPTSGPCAGTPDSLSASQTRARGCGVGNDAPLLLRATPYTKVVIEVAATAGAAPRQAALDHVVSVFQDLCDKPGGVTVKLGDMNIPAPGHPLTIEDVRTIEDAHRTQFALGDTAVFFYLVVSDPSADDTSSAKVLGQAHRASSMVIFQGTVNSISGGLTGPSAADVESAVVAHELGHVLGLVNLGTPMVTPHQDTAHGNHDSNKNCIMYWANNSTSGLTSLLTGGGTIPDFDAQCRADLLAMRNAK